MEVFAPLRVAAQAPRPGRHVNFGARVYASPYHLINGRPTLLHLLFALLIIASLLLLQPFRHLSDIGRFNAVAIPVHKRLHDRHLMAASRVVIWLHGLGDNGPNNVPIKSFFASPEFKNVKWVFPSAPSQPVTCNGGLRMPSWFDIFEIPITDSSPNDEEGLVKAVQNVHKMVDKEVAEGIGANKIFLCGFSQGGALALASTMLFPKTLAGTAVFSGWVPMNATFLERATQEGKQTQMLWLHGMDDPVVKFEAGQAGPPLLGRTGVNCEFKAYPKLGHSISPEELAYLKNWMKSRMQ